MLFNTSTYYRSLGSDERHSLAHHVRTHQCTVSIVVLKEWNQCGCYGSNLLRSDVHEVNLCWRYDWVVGILTAFHDFTYEVSVLLQWCITLTDNLCFLFFGRKINDIIVIDIADSVLNLAIRSLDKSEIIYLCVYTKRGDKTDVWSFRRLDRTETSVVCIVHVTYLKASTLTSKTARTEG